MRDKAKQEEIHTSGFFSSRQQKTGFCHYGESYPPHSTYLKAGFVHFPFHTSRAFLHSYYSSAFCFMFLILALWSQFATYGLLGVDLQLLA